VARRTIALSPQYLSNAAQLGIFGGSDASRAIARLILSLAASDMLPMPGDVTTLVAPDERGGGKRVTCLPVLLPMWRAPVRGAAVSKSLQKTGSTREDGGGPRKTTSVRERPAILEP
jgi:hypothetical protein